MMKRRKEVWIKKYGDFMGKVMMFIVFDGDKGNTLDGREVNKIDGRWVCET